MPYYVFHYVQQNVFVALDGPTPADGWTYKNSSYTAMSFDSLTSINLYIKHLAPEWLRDMLSKGTMTIKKIEG